MKGKKLVEIEDLYQKLCKVLGFSTKIDKEDYLQNNMKSFRLRIKSIIEKNY